MQLDYALLADKATLTHDKKLVVLGGDIDSVTVRELPSLVQITLVAKTVFGRDEQREGHTFGLECVTPDGQVKRVSEGIPMEITGTPEEGRLPAARVIIDLAIVFSEAGSHTIRLLLDGSEAKSFPFRVKHVAEAETK
jgi:hypothetical protein